MAVKRARLSEPAPISDLLPMTFHGTPTERRLREGRIWLAWDEAVGEQIAGRARPVSFRDGTLTVSVTSAPWMQQLSLLRKRIADKLNSMLGEPLVKDIFLKAGKAQRLNGDYVTSNRSVRPLTDEDQQRIDSTTGTIGDSELRQTLSSLLKKHLESLPS